jgi:Fe-S cluster biogenesis protein NfuA
LLIETERTPNPEALRILPGVRLWNGAPVEFAAGEDADDAPLAARLLEIDGIASVMIGADFVTLLRASPDHEWARIKPEAIATIADFLHAGLPAVIRAGPDLGADLPADDLVVAQIRDVLERHVRPVLARDGGEATLVGFDHQTGVARVHMGGACGGCPSGMMTLKRGIEQTVKRYVPEVSRVEAGAAEAQAGVDPKARFRAWVKAKWGVGS